MAEQGQSATEQLRQIKDARTNAFYQAFGAAADDPVNPLVIAAVKENRVAHLQIDDAVLAAYQEQARARPGDSSNKVQQRHQMALLEFVCLVNGVMKAAMTEWQKDFARRLGGTNGIQGQ